MVWKSAEDRRTYYRQWVANRRAISGYTRLLKHYPPSAKQQVRELAATGLSYESIEYLTGVHRSTVRRYIKEGDATTIKAG